MRPWGDETVQSQPDLNLNFDACAYNLNITSFTLWVHDARFEGAAMEELSLGNSIE